MFYDHDVLANMFLGSEGNVDKTTGNGGYWLPLTYALDHEVDYRDWEGNEVIYLGGTSANPLPRPMEPDEFHAWYKEVVKEARRHDMFIYFPLVDGPLTSKLGPIFGYDSGGTRSGESPGYCDTLHADDPPDTSLITDHFFREYTLRKARQITTALADEPIVFGWEYNNEPDRHDFVSKASATSHYVDMTRILTDYEPDFCLTDYTPDGTAGGPVSIGLSTDWRELTVVADKHCFSSGMSPTRMNGYYLVDQTALSKSGKTYSFEDFEFYTNLHYYASSGEYIAGRVSDVGLVDGQHDVPLMLMEVGPYDYDGNYPDEFIYSGTKYETDHLANDDFNIFWRTWRTSRWEWANRTDHLSTSRSSPNCSNNDGYRATLDKRSHYLDQPDRYAYWAWWFDALHSEDFDEGKAGVVLWKYWTFSHRHSSSYDQGTLFPNPNALVSPTYPMDSKEVVDGGWNYFLLDYRQPEELGTGDANFYDFYISLFSKRWGIESTSGSITDEPVLQTGECP